MTLETRAAFARRLKWNRSSVTRAVKDGRVLLEGKFVNVEESLRRIEALAHPAPHHQAHARQLEEQRSAKTQGEGGQVMNSGAGSAQPPEKQQEGIEALNLRLKRAEADKREHEAEMTRMERETMAGNLIAREDVEFALDDFGATLRSLMESFADRLAPVVYPLQSIEETHGALADAAQDVLATMNGSLLKLARDKGAV